MTYQVLLGSGGLAGWNILKRTASTQKEIIANEAQVKRTLSYAKEAFSKVTSAAELVDDYRLLSVTLKAFGLEDDINNKFFIQKVISEGHVDEKAFANKLSDKRYLALARAFGSSVEGGQFISEGSVNRLLSSFIDREFESRVGEGDPTLRLALNAKREILKLSLKPSNNDTRWFEVLGQPPLRTVFSAAFGFDKAYARLPIDRQLQEFKNAAQRQFGSNSLDIFSDPSKLDKLLKNFVVRESATANQAARPYSVALTLLSANSQARAQFYV